MGLGSTFIPREIQERFEVLRPIAPTKRWETYLAEDRRDGALCVLRIDRTRPETPEEREHLKESLLRLRRVQHPALAPLRRFGLPPRGGYYTVHEFVSGSTLEDLRGEMDWATVVNAMVRILPGLHLLHLSGIVHQRLSGDRIVLQPTEAGRRFVVAGTGPSAKSDGRRWSDWSLKAPEVARGESYDGRADLYSLAVTVHELMTGHPPAAAAVAERAAKLGEHRDVPPMRAFRDDCPPILEEILMRMGSHDPRARPRSALHLAQELRRTGLYVGEPPRITSTEVINATRWRLVDSRVRELLDLLPPEDAILSVTSDPGHETLAKEVEAHLAFRRGRTVFEAGGADRQSGLRLHLARGRNSTPMCRKRTQNELHFSVRVSTDRETVADWVNSLVSGPLDRHRAPLVARWLHWLTRGDESQVCRRLPLTISPVTQDVTVDWRRLQHELAESLRAGTAHLGDTEFPARSPRANARHVAKAALPVAAAEILRRHARATSCASGVHARVAMHLADAGLSRQAAQEFRQAAKLLSRTGSELAVALALRADWLDADDDHTSEHQPDPSVGGPTSSIRAMHWAAAVEAERHFQRGEAVEAVQVAGAALNAMSARLASGSRDAVRQWLALARPQFRYLRMGYGPEASRQLVRRSSEVRQEGYIHTGEEMEYLAYSVVDGVRGKVQRALNCAKIALDRYSVRGRTYSAAIAMELMAGLESREGRLEPAIQWSERALSAQEKEGLSRVAVRRLTTHGVLHCLIGDYRGAIAFSLMSLRRVPRHSSSIFHYGQSTTIGLSLVSLGRLHRAHSWLRRSLDESRSQTPRHNYRNTLLGLVGIQVARGCHSELGSLVADAVTSGVGLHRDEAGGLVHSLLFSEDCLGIVTSSLTGEVAEALNAIIDCVRAYVPQDGLVKPHESPNVSGGTSEDECEFTARAIRWCAALASGLGSGIHHSWPGIERLARRLIDSGELLYSVKLAGMAAPSCLVQGNLEGAARLQSVWARARAPLRRDPRDAASESLAKVCCDGEMEDLQVVLSRYMEVFQRIADLECELQETTATTDGSPSLRARLDTRTLSYIDEIVCLGVGEAKVRTISATGSNVEVAGLGGEVHGCARMSGEEFERILSLLPDDACLQWKLGSSDRAVVVRPGSDRLVVYVSFSEALDQGADSVSHSVQMVRLLADSISRQMAEAEPVVRSRDDAQSRGINSRELALKHVDLGAGFRLLYASGQMAAALRSVERLARRKSPVMLIGESGTGKELLARLYHRVSSAKGSHFVPVDCPALCAGVAESELFGHEAGAFTGASHKRTGLIEDASGGTLFLDEIGDLPVGMQAKLLRVLSVSEVRPVGGGHPRKVRFGLVSATNVELSEAVQEGAFRSDLFHRMGIPVRVPPLRERRADILPLWDWFLAAYYGNEGIPRYEGAAVDLLMSFDWPGNVRQLENVARAAHALSDDHIIAGSVVESLLHGHTVDAKPVVCADREWAVSDRKWKALDLVRRFGRVSRSTYAERAGISERSALRDLNELVVRGLLHRVGKGRGTRYVQADGSAA